MIVFYLILTISTAIYIIIDYRLLKGLKRLKLGQNENHPKVSVVISAKDEEKNIRACLESLLLQSYAPYDIWVADDRSQDQTLNIISELASVHNRLNFISIKDSDNLEGWSPKKFALHKLIQASQSEVILTTDADCILPVHWIQSMVKEFEDGIQFVVGFSYYKRIPHMSEILYQIQALEFFSHMVVAAGAIAQKFPITSSGTSLGYKRSWFESVSGFDGIGEVRSGDDDLLLHKISSSHPDSIRFCFHPEGEVNTFPAPTLSILWNQRKRWASKTTLYTPRVVSLLTFVFTYYSILWLSFVAGGLIWLTTGRTHILLATISYWLIKTGMDYWVMRLGANKFNKPDLMKIFIPTAILHIPLIVCSVIFGIFSNFEWKEQKT